MKNDIQFGGGTRRAVLSADAGTNNRLTVETIDNHIYFYAEVDSDRCLALKTDLQYADTHLREEYYSRSLDVLEYPQIPIFLHISSDGGELWQAFSVTNAIRSLKTPVYSIIEGVCASAATLISMACSKRYIQPNGLMMIHQVSGAVWGKFNDMQDYLSGSKIGMEQLTAFYAKHSKLDKKAIQKILDRDTFMDAETAIKNGFVDEVWG